MRKYRKVGDPYHIFLEMTEVTEIFWECVKEKIDTKILKKKKNAPLDPIWFTKTSPAC